jgi:23S rRNA (cytosine1962-C5)-methyltransferase
MGTLKGFPNPPALWQSSSDVANFLGVTIPRGLDVRRRPALSLESLALAKSCEPGRQVRLLDGQGQLVACGIADPDNDLIHLLSTEPLPRGFDLSFFAARVRSSLALRKAVGLVASERSYRLVNAEGDGLPGFSVDRFGDYAVVCAPSRPLLPFARLLAQAVLAEVGDLRGAVIKVRSKDPQDRSCKDEVVGERPAEKYVTTELGTPYEVHLLGALNVGLFPDMREQRRNIGRFVAGRRVLNAFSYTGAISVAAARAGAASVTSVDLSSGVLAWARENFRLSGLATENGRFSFEVSDVRRFMEKKVEQHGAYDTIIMDPPTVSAARASGWSMKKDYPQLIALATRLLPSTGGLLWISANARRGPSVLRHVEDGIRLSGRTATVLELGGLPPDFPTPCLLA